MGRSSIGPVNFDSPSATAALGALDLNAIHDADLQDIGSLSRMSDDERVRRLDAVIATLSVCSPCIPGLRHH